MTARNQAHEAVLARIAELEADNARLAAENEVLRAGAPLVPRRLEIEPSHRPILTDPAVLGRVLLYIVAFLLGEA